MARLKLLTYVGLGVMLTLTFLPQTSWVVQNHLDMILRSQGPPPPGGWLMPRAIFVPGDWPNDTEEAQLARALYAESDRAVTDTGEPALVPLEQFCSAHPENKLGWACLLRNGAGVMLHSPQEPLKHGVSRTPSHDQILRRDRIRAVLLGAATRGEALDPENCYFSLMKAILLESEDRHLEAQQALTEASGKRQYREYLYEQVDLTIRTMERRWGYRGYGARSVIFAGVTLPHFAAMRNVLPYVVTDPKGKPVPELQLKLAICCETLMRGTTTLVEAFVAQAVFARAISGHFEDPLVRFNAAKLAPAAKELDRKLNTTYITGLLNHFDRSALDDHVLASMNQAGENLEAVVNEPPTWPNFLLLCLFTSLFIVPLCISISAVKRAIRAPADSKPNRPWLWAGEVLLLTLAVAWLGLCEINFVQWVQQFATLAAITAILAVVVLPRKTGNPLAVLALVFTLAPAFYLYFVAHELSVDRDMKALDAQFRMDSEKVRDGWKAP